MLKAAAALVDAAVGGGAGPAQPSAELAVALLTVLELAPHTEGCVACAAALQAAGCGTPVGRLACVVCQLDDGHGATGRVPMQSRMSHLLSLPAGRCCVTSATPPHPLSTSRNPAVPAACQRPSWRAARYEACSCCPSCSGQWRLPYRRCCSTPSRTCDGVPRSVPHWCLACRTPAAHRCGQGSSLGVPVCAAAPSLHQTFHSLLTHGIISMRV